jgi:hypothetical protein
MEAWHGSVLLLLLGDEVLYLPVIVALATVAACPDDTGNSWLRKVKWPVDFARGNGKNHIHFRQIMDMFHCCVRIFCTPNAYIVMVHLTTHMKCHSSETQLLSKPVFF